MTLLADTAENTQHETVVVDLSVGLGELTPTNLVMTRSDKPVPVEPSPRLGSIADATKAAEDAGAAAVRTGTAAFARPNTMAHIAEEPPALVAQLGAAGLADLIGILTVRPEEQQ